MIRRVPYIAAVLLFLFGLRLASAQSLESELQLKPVAELVEKSKRLGDPSRGALVYHLPQMACRQCHEPAGDAAFALGPSLTDRSSQATDERLIESILWPSKSIRQDYETLSIRTTEGEIVSGFLVERTQAETVLRDIAKGGTIRRIPAEEIEEWKIRDTSLMPNGQINALKDVQQFYDLVRYLMEIRDGGLDRARQLKPSESAIAASMASSIPEYEKVLDHAGFIRDWDRDSYVRGESIYKRVCGNCHGTLDQPGSLPTSLRFAEGQFKNGSDPHSMYRTLTYGFGQMVAQSWMVPSQKYDVIYYIREHYLSRHNPSQFTRIDDEYLAKLPKGSSRGPEPSNIEAWSSMDYGPSLAHTFEVPGTRKNFAYKGIAVRLDGGVGGVARGRHWMLFDTDTLRMAAAWSASAEASFIDWRGIQFNGEHGIHPTLVGEVGFRTPQAPGWADPDSGSFADDQRVLGRDQKRYGPLPRDWGRFKGVYHHGQKTVFSYSVGGTDVLESPGYVESIDQASRPIALRILNIGPREQALELQVAEHPSSDVRLQVQSIDGHSIAQLAPRSDADSDLSRVRGFDGRHYIQFAESQSFDMFSQDFTVAARIRTQRDGSLWSVSDGGPKWVPNGQSLFIRDGKLCFDIGWVGFIRGKKRVDDGEWHDIGVSWRSSDKSLRFFVDGVLDGEGLIAAKSPLKDPVVRIGFTAPNFPARNVCFEGDIVNLRYYRRFAESPNEFKDLQSMEASRSLMAGSWFDASRGEQAWTSDELQKKGLEIVSVAGVIAEQPKAILAAVWPPTPQIRWGGDGSRLTLKIDPGEEPLSFAIWQPLTSDSTAKELSDSLQNRESLKGELVLKNLTKGGPSRWPQTMRAPVLAGSEEGPFAVDQIVAPESNPWFAQTRFTGLDFFADGSLAICTWDGDVWHAKPASDSSIKEFEWRRIASGMFQPLGLKVISDKIHVTCRDQLCVLHDLNGDAEIDFYECFNNDHQVTEHFHEFAMGLQVDAEGNFYYAKSGCHGKAAIVPHHGTLLKVSRDGSKTTILANGFRAANGVCLNPDGSFFVTDQEGFWNPKNRINWVTLSESGHPKFYGNMLGYHDVTDTSDSAMEPPLCWITNSFDRSPAELLWVESPKWGKLHGRLLNLSYGYGKVFLVPHERVDGKMQGGMIELPLPSFPTGVMRGRFHPKDEHLYLCGMFAWAGNATAPGGLYRIRATNRPVCMPVELRALRDGIQLGFTEPLDKTSVQPDAFSVSVWGLERTAKYGSKHIDEKDLQVRSVILSQEGTAIDLKIDGIKPTWGMQIQYSLRTASGESLEGTLHNTIHMLPD
jgi:putative heme-binding domain-containing protein